MRKSRSKHGSARKEEWRSLLKRKRSVWRGVWSKTDAFVSFRKDSSILTGRAPTQWNNQQWWSHFVSKDFTSERARLPGWKVGLYISRIYLCLQCFLYSVRSFGLKRFWAYFRLQYICKLLYKMGKGKLTKSCVKGNSTIKVRGR